MLKLGVSKKKITPSPPIYLAGFAHRKGPAKKFFNDLYLKTFLLENNEQKFLMIIGDIIWWDDHFVLQLKEAIQRNYKISKKQILFHATHNHSGPQMSSKFSVQLGKLDQNYLSLVKNKILISISEAHSNLEKVKLTSQTGSSSVGIYRRKKINDKINMAPNEQVYIDSELKVYSFLTLQDNVKAIWIHYSCHPTSTDENVISSEFPGICCEEIESIYPGCVVGFLQGFCGDIRPKQVKNDQFYRGKIDDLIDISNNLVKDIKYILQNKDPVSLSAAKNFVFKELMIPLKFSRENMESQAPKELRDEWLHLVQTAKETNLYTLHLQYIHISNHLKIITANAEMVNSYGLFIKRLNPFAIPLGYSNGMTGYIPTAKQLSAGGYEAEESIFYFGYPSKLDHEVEKQIKKGIKTLI